jgi:hypothetical protein
LAEIRRRWLDSQVFDFNDAKALELARLDDVIFKAWTAFEASKHQRRHTERRAERCRAGAATTNTTDVESAGDPRWLQIVLNAIETRCKILGLHGVSTIKPGPDVLATAVDQLSDADLNAIDDILKRAVERRQIEAWPMRHD